jgi:serralysin
MIGGDGNDIYFVDNVGDVVIESAGEGNDTVQSTVTYTLSADVDRLFLTGAAATDGTGNDIQNVLLGNSAANTLSGQGGNDLIYGELGNDTLTGGTGLDAFYFRTALNESTNLDVITDFSHVDDAIFIDNAIFTGLANGALAASAFTTGTAAADASDRIIYDTTTGALYFDADGLGGVDQVQFATLSNLASGVNAGDFFVI